jgi:hypothetical protein
MQRSERRIEVANGVQADVEAVGDISLELADGFTILLRDVLFVPSLHKNLISVSRLDKDSYECYFAHGKCAISSINVARLPAFSEHERASPFDAR